MAFFAEIDETMTVTRVIVVEDELVLDGADNIDEAIGAEYCRALTGSELEWRLTAIDGSVQTRYAGPGYILEEGLGAFIKPSPYPSWVIDGETTSFVPPIPMPEEPLFGNAFYDWDESTESWVIALPNES